MAWIKLKKLTNGSKMYIVLQNCFVIHKIHKKTIRQCYYTLPKQLIAIN